MIIGFFLLINEAYTFMSNLTFLKTFKQDMREQIELFMKCGLSTYKYIKDPAGDKVFYKHKKGTKNIQPDFGMNSI